MATSNVNITHDFTNDTSRDFVEKNAIMLVGFVLPFLPNIQRFMEVYSKGSRSQIWRCPED
jgi:hypothetical protein